MFISLIFNIFFKFRRLSGREYPTHDILVLLSDNRELNFSEKIRVNLLLNIIIEVLLYRYFYKLVNALFYISLGIFSKRFRRFLTTGI